MTRVVVVTLANAAISAATERRVLAAFCMPRCSFAPAVPFARCSVLMVDDEDFIRDVTEDFLNTLEVGRIEQASDGADGLRKLTSGGAPFTLVLMDLQMPAMDGFETARLLREWNGVTHVVDVTEQGYRWREQTWRSLSAIAREITGAHWSGPRFFGLHGGAGR